jgi:hypothetical protein
MWDPPISSGQVFGEYSYLRFNPTLSRLNNRSFNGGGGGAQAQFRQDFWYQGRVHGVWEHQVDQDIRLVSDLAERRGNPGGSYWSQVNMFTYLFRPLLTIPIPEVKPFGELLFGGSNRRVHKSTTSNH